MLAPRIIAQHKYDSSRFEKEVAEYLKTQEIITRKTKTYRKKQPFNVFDANISAVEQKLSPFIFDPNTLPYAGFVEMGLTEKQALAISKYRVKGGRFRKKEDFKKIYTISEKEYAVLEPFIEIKPSPDLQQTQQEKVKKAEPLVMVDINTATEDELKKINGIGNYFAEQIVTYRNRLGGFNAKEQLLEVPKMDSAKYALISPHVEVNLNAIRRINVNTATFDELKVHPYLGYNIALSLVNYRTKHGNFVKVEDIKKSALITEKNFPKISYYLCTK
ncbi:MAG TPA: helix-hairpin-helix domain-containing protein [Bacteroidales bacterium]|nr:helix-hairpin-helix domain-containing protein [Bacteroidales bacterium]